MTDLGQFPHCDQRILHKPGDCEFCDMRPEWQALRKAWGIAFTGQVPASEGDRCGALLPREQQSNGARVCMQARGHGDDIPHMPSEPWEALPCPADYAVQRHERGDYNLWGGNVPYRGSTPNA